MAEYTPDADQVRRYWQYGANAWADGVARDNDTQADGTSIGAELDRWLNQVKAEVWSEGFKAGHDCTGSVLSEVCPDREPNPYINKEESK